MYNAIERLIRVARRFAASGQLSSSPVQMVRRIFDAKPVFFVQVGANDGLSGDPLHDLIVVNPLWRGIFIEPVDYVFEKLVENYGRSDRFVFERIAIAEETGEREFYYVSEKALGDPNVPLLSDKLGSFNLSHITNHSPSLEKYIISKKIHCEPLDKVLKRHGVTDIDIFHIDVEGYDYHVLKQIDFTRYNPRMILFEHAHLSTEELLKSRILLENNGYKLINFGLDTMAIMAKSNKA